MAARRLTEGHNGGPPLDADEKPHVPEWGRGGIGTYFAWRAAHRAVWKAVTPDTALRHLARAQSLGLTYEEYRLELLERGRYLSDVDTERIAAIKARRRTKRKPKDRHT
jgi:hypothetical protein